MSNINQTEDQSPNFNSEFQENITSVQKEQDVKGMSKEGSSEEDSTKKLGGIKGFGRKIKNGELKQVFLDFFKNYKSLVIYALSISGIFILFLLGSLLFSSETPVDEFANLTNEKYKAMREKLMSQKIEADISRAMELVVGEGHYSVSAIVTLGLVDETIDQLKFVPQVVTLNYADDVNNRFEGFDRASRFESRFNLPGLFDNVKTNVASGVSDLQRPNDAVSTGNQQVVITDDLLPGFESMGMSNQDASLMGNAPFMGNNQSGPDKVLNHMVSKKSKQQVFINRTKTKKVLPKYNIQNIFVSVVLDQRVTDKLDIKKSEITKLLTNMGNYQRARGDKVVVSIMNFNESLWNIREGIITARKFVTGISIWVYLGVLMSIFLGIFIYKGLKSFLQKKSLKKETLAQEAEIKKQKEIEEKVKSEKKWFDQRKALLELADKNPDALASLLADWIDRDAVKT